MRSMTCCFARVDRKILALSASPRPTGYKKLKGYKDVWRIRVADYRVIYIIDDAGKMIVITRITHRKEAYER